MSGSGLEGKTPRSAIGSANVTGGLIQLSQVTSTLVFTLILPRILGPRDFGMASAALAFPYGVYGMLERPVWSALQIGARREPEHAPGRVAGTLLMALALMAGVCLLLAPAFPGIGAGGALGPVRVAALALVPMALNVASLGWSYARSRPGHVLAANLVHGGVLTLASLAFALAGFGALAPPLGLLSAQVTTLAVLGLRGALVRPHAPAGVGLTRDEGRAMALAFPVQLPTVVVTALAVPAMAAWLNLEGAAAYRIAVGLLVAAATATPLSPAVVQMTVGELAHRNEGRALRRYLAAVTGVAALFGALWLAFFLVPAPTVLNWILGDGYADVTGSLALVGAGCLPWSALSLSASVLLGLRGHRAVAGLSVVTSVALALALAVAGITTGEIGVVLKVLVVALWGAALLHGAVVLVVLRRSTRPTA